MARSSDEDPNESASYYLTTEELARALTRPSRASIDAGVEEKEISLLGCPRIGGMHSDHLADPDDGVCRFCGVSSKTPEPRTMPSPAPKTEALSLFKLCALHGYTLTIDPAPQERSDAMGDTQWKRIADAQLCANKVIAVKAVTRDAVYCISHELAHGIVGFEDEKMVLLEQADILARWVKTLMKEIEDHGHNRN